MATARRTAAALGIIAFVFVGALGLWQGAELDWVLLRGLLALICFAVFGFVVGHIGAAIASDAAAGELRRRVQAETVKQRRSEAERAAREKETPENQASRQAPAGAPAPEKTGRT